MDTLLRAAEAALRQSAAPALRLGELLREVRAETRNLRLDGTRLLGVLRTRPDLFRVLDPWRGPWRFIREPDPRGERLPLDPWIVMVTDPADGDGADRPATRRMRACVRWLARGVDTRSPRALARWSGMALAAEETHRALEEAA